jgi:hypothetical protein
MEIKGIKPGKTPEPCESKIILKLIWGIQALRAPN